MRCKKQSRAAIRLAISATIAVLIAIIVEWQYAASQEGWIVMTALLTSQTTRGTPFKQGLYFYILISIGIITGAGLTYLVPSAFILQLVAAIIFIIGGMIVYYNRPLQDITYFTIILLPLILLIVIMLPAANMELLSGRLLDALIGAGIGVTCRQIICPVRPYKDMVAGLEAILSALADYSRELAAYFSDNESKLNKKRIAIEKALQESGGMYPEWVYEAGFNPGLRSGYRFFLVYIERVSEVFFAIDSLLAEDVLQQLPSSTHVKIANVLTVNCKLIEALRAKLNGKAVAADDIDMTSDVDDLENEIGTPAGNIYLTTLARDLNDVRQLLLQLLLSVPER